VRPFSLREKDRMRGKKIRQLHFTPLSLEERGRSFFGLSID